MFHFHQQQQQQQMILWLQQCGGVYGFLITWLNKSLPLCWLCNTYFDFPDKSGYIWNVSVLKHNCFTAFFFAFCFFEGITIKEMCQSTIFWWRATGLETSPVWNKYFSIFWSCGVPNIPSFFVVEHPHWAVRYAYEYANILFSLSQDSYHHMTFLSPTKGKK